MFKAIICTISALLIIGCATAPDTNRLNSSMERLNFYSQMLTEMSEAIDILSDDSLSVKDRMWIYKAKMDLIDMKVKAFEAKCTK